MARLYTRKQFYTKLTHRQRQFLEKIVEIYTETGEPVEYTVVSEAMGVSKWTAYDILQELHKKGFLKVEYKVHPGPGRSKIHFIPKTATVEMTKQESKKSTLNVISEWIKERFEKYEKMGISKAISVISRKVEKEKNPLAIVLYTTVLFIMFAKAFKIDIKEIVNLDSLFDSKIRPSVLLSFLMELMFSLSDKEESILEKLHLRNYTITKFKNLQKLFRENVMLITPAEQTKVLSVIQEMI